MLLGLRKPQTATARGKHTHTKVLCKIAQIVLNGVVLLHKHVQNFNWPYAYIERGAETNIK